MASSGRAQIFNFKDAYFEIGQIQYQFICVVRRELKGDSKFISNTLKAQSWTFEMKAQLYMGSIKVRGDELKM